ncbi:hypothetical protein QBC35DRAFT_393821, partial [Podospora australis]
TAPIRNKQQEIKKFSFGFGDQITEYQHDPSPQVDKLWKDLYRDTTIVKLTPTEASLLPNKTHPFFRDRNPDGSTKSYIATLAVFHQIHCLRILHLHPPPRKVPPKYWPLRQTHLNHCVNATREALMFQADTSVMAWKSHGKKSPPVVHSDVLHQCRDFNAVKAWAKERSGVEQFEEAVVLGLVRSEEGI